MLSDTSLKRKFLKNFCVRFYHEYINDLTMKSN